MVFERDDGEPRALGLPSTQFVSDDTRSLQTSVREIVPVLELCAAPAGASRDGAEHAQRVETIAAADGADGGAFCRFINSA